MTLDSTRIDGTRKPNHGHTGQCQSDFDHGVVGDLTTIDADSAEGFLCILNTYRSTGSSGGEVRDHAEPRSRHGMRIDGVWKIQQVDIDDTQICDWEEASA